MRMNSHRKTGFQRAGSDDRAPIERSRPTCPGSHRRSTQSTPTRESFCDSTYGCLCIAWRIDQNLLNKTVPGPTDRARQHAEPRPAPGPHTRRSPGAGPRGSAASGPTPRARARARRRPVSRARMADELRCFFQVKYCAHGVQAYGGGNSSKSLKMSFARSSRLSAARRAATSS